jgi:extracellular elastinolytic metalloproteinase
MTTYPEGVPPIMNMGLVSSTNRHTAMDADVVFHEYTHGLTNRLVGGPMNTHALQTLMGEGWSDYFALTIQNYIRDVDKAVTGDWVVNKATGIRRAAYNDNYPNTYGSIARTPEVHDIGEVWCATLMMMTRKARNAIEDTHGGYRICWQIVVDGLKLTPDNPTFLQARDAILKALDYRLAANWIPRSVYDRVRKAAWQAFAHFGMGVNASSASTGVDGIIEDFTMPNDLVA